MADVSAGVCCPQEKHRDYPLKSPGIKPLAPSSRHSSSSGLRGAVSSVAIDKSMITHRHFGSIGSASDAGGGGGGGGSMGDTTSLLDVANTPVSTPPHTPNTPISPVAHAHDSKAATHGGAGGGDFGDFAIVTLPQQEQDLGTYLYYYGVYEYR